MNKDSLERTRDIVSATDNEAHPTIVTEESLLPVRSVQAHAFCPRLFWLEQKAGLFEVNEHVVEGRAAHVRVDVPGGRISTAQGDEAFHARALWLSSTDLHVSGKLDLVDEIDGRVLPVDTKKGKAPKDGGLWPADAVQVALQGLLLREAGFRVDEVAVFYAASQKRVRISLSEDLAEEARSAVDAARNTLSLPLPPTPLVDSPKCPGCSLNAICQPDEYNVLKARIEAPDEHRPLRRVVPESADARPAYVAEAGARIGVKGQSLEVTPRDPEAQKTRIGLAQVSHLALVGSPQISTQALKACLEAGVPVALLSSGGRFYGAASGEGSANVYVRMAQFAAHETPNAVRIARVLIADKIANQRTLLRRNQEANPDLARLARLAKDCGATESSAQLLAREGEAAKRYWHGFSELLAETDEAFRMQGRSRRPPRDASNAMVSFASGLLVKDCLFASQMAGLDPYLGVFHTPHHGRPSMALDLMEPFRPLLVDSVVLGVIRRGEVSPSGFIDTGQAVAMRPETRKSLIVAYERRLAELITHPVFHYRISYRQVLTVQARLLARVLTGELSDMPPFRTR